MLLASVSPVEKAGVTTSFERIQRLVAFIDILGWRAMASASKDDPELRCRLAECLRILASGAYLKHQDYLRDRQFAQFTDGILISAATTNMYDLRHLIWDILVISRALLKRGVVVRGGITKGLLYHRDGFAIGPARGSARWLEAKLAIYPRVVIDPGLAILAVESQHAFDGEGRWLGSDRTVREDSDEILFVDYLQPEGAFQLEHVQVVQYDRHDAREHFNAARRVILRGLTENRNQPAILRKYAWLKTYYNAVASDEYGQPQIENDR